MNIKVLTTQSLIYYPKRSDIRKISSYNRIFTEGFLFFILQQKDGKTFKTHPVYMTFKSKFKSTLLKQIFFVFCLQASKLKKQACVIFSKLPMTK